MNKNAVLLVTALAFSACTVAPDKAITIVDGNEIIITAHQEGYDCTKTSVIDGGTQVYWEPGDEIKLFYGEYSSKFTSLNTEYATTASFSGVIDGFAGNNEGVMSGEKYVWGLYPYNSDAASDGNSVTTTLPSFQKGQEGSFAKNTHIAVAKSSNIDLAFYNVTTGLRFKLINSGIKSVKIESNDEEPIAGKFKVAFEGGYPLVQEIVNGQSSVTLAAPDGGTFETGKWYYIVTLPQTLASGFKVIFNRAGGKAERSTSNSVTIRRGIFLSIDRIDEGVEFPTWVDLGLSVKWADRNIGASNPEEYGDYYAWGETEPKSNYAWSTYKYCNGSSKTLTKYCTKSSYGYNGFTDNKAVLDLSDDAARVKLGGSWRMPTYAEWGELINNCTWTWTTQNGVKGYRVTSKTNGNSIFLPIAGHRSGTSLVNAGNYGLYASSSLCTDIAPYLYWRLDFGRNDIVSIKRDYTERYVGLSVRPVYGDCIPVESVSLSNSSLTIFEDETYKLSATFIPANAWNQLVYWTSNNTSVATVSSTGLVTAVKAGTATITVKTQDGNKTATCSVTVQSGMVDLGLSVKWRNRNLGASTPEGYGGYYAWGETSTKFNYAWSTYKYCNGSETTMTKYCNDSSYGYNGFTDNKTVLDLSDDAARVKLGGSWRMPTDDEWTELREQCTWTWTTQNGVNGYTVTSKTNDNSIFLPAAGYRYDTYLYGVGSEGYYWSSSLNADNPIYAWKVRFNSSNIYRNYDDRYHGQSIRPVYGDCIPVESVSLSNSSLSLAEEGTYPLVATIQPANAWNTSVNWTSNNTSVATVSSTGLVTAVKAGTATITVKTQDGNKTATCSVTVQSPMVDLGLSVKWRNRNLGASTPEGYGDYYAWGETETKSSYSWSTYKYCNGSATTLTKYCTKSSYGNNGFTDNKTVLNLSDDAARVKLGGSWRMPTDDEWTELREQCTWTWTTQNGVNGYQVTSKTNGNSIFLPAAGFRGDTGLGYVGSSGYYWSYSLNADTPFDAWLVYFRSSSISRSNYDCYRCYGQSIRPVYGDCIPVESVSLSNSSLTITEGETYKLTATVNPANAWNQSVNWTSNNTSVATVSSTGLVTAVKAGTATITVKTQDGNKTATCSVTVSGMVDLGLSVKWRNRNLGASTPEGYGDYYAWGETITKSNYAYDWSTYKYCNGSETTLTKYCNKSSYGNNGFTDNKIVLDLSDDAARVKLGGSWRMPTDEEWTELREQCTWTWTTQNGVNGYQVTSKTNGNSIFLPAAGYRGARLKDVGSTGVYWSSSLNTDFPYDAWHVYFSSSRITRYSYDGRYFGLSIRPVFEK